jgi:hypothetical protein
MPGLSFLNVAFLAGIAAAALPILIHLFSRRRAPRLEWGSTRFLRELNRQRIRRVKLRQLLLLALRALAVVLFALAMGRPAITGGWGVGGKAPSTAVLLLDTSYSMSAVRGEASTFDLARRRAGEILDLLGEGDEAYLVTAGGEAESFTPYAVQDLGLVREHVAKLAPSHRAGGMGEGLALASRLLAGSKNLNRELYVISDLQRSAWTGIADSTAVDFGLPPAAAVCVSGLGNEALDNLAIDQVDVERSGQSGGSALLVTVSNHTGHAQSSVPVRATIGDRPAGEVFADLPAGGQVQVRIELGPGPWPAAGGHVSIPEDALGLDDVRYFVLEAGRRPQVGIVDDLGGGGGGGEYVRLALAPSVGVGRFEVRMIPSAALAGADLSELSVVILAGVSQIERDGVEQLKTFVRGGGGLLIFPGEHSDLRAYSDRLLPALLPVKLAGIVDTAGESASRAFALTPTGQGHPIFAGFTAERGERLTQARFTKVVRVMPGAGRVIAQFRPDLPAMIEGQGVLLFTSSVDGAWNDLPTSAAFLPILHQSVSYLARAGSQGASILTGDRVERQIPAPATPTRYRMLDARDEEIPLETIERGKTLLLRSAPIERAGTYRIVDASGKEVAAAAVNLDTRESDLALADRGEVARLFGERPVSILDGHRPVSGHVRELREGRELWRFVLLLALIVLVTEVVLSRGKGAFTPAAS